MMKTAGKTIRNLMLMAFLGGVLMTLPLAQTKAEEAQSTSSKTEQPEAKTTSVSAETSTASDVVQGGADNIPLSVALRQILPPQKNFTTAKDVDANVMVSWKGGRPWRDVMHDVLKSVNLIAIEKGDTFAVQKITLSTLPNQKNAWGSASSEGKGVQDSDASLTGVWSAERGVTLRTLLQEWCNHAKIDLTWNSSFDYPVMTAVRIEGTFEEAVQTVLGGFEKANPRPYGRLYRNSNVGNPVLVIEARGNNYGE